MIITDDIKSSLTILNNTNIIPDATYKKLVENALEDLIQSKSSDLRSLCPTKPDVIKEVYATLMKLLLHFTQNNFTKDKAYILTAKECKVDINRSKWLSEQYEKNKIALMFKLGNIGTHLPHIVDVNWEIDYLIKSSSSDASEGPLFNITLITEQFSREADSKKQEMIVFWCTSQEMQDLVYKFEDAVRHCQKIANGH